MQANQGLPFWHQGDSLPQATIPKLFTSYDQGLFVAGLSSQILNLTVVAFKPPASSLR